MPTNLCGRKTRRCRKCKRRYPKEEIDLLNCPVCGENRVCGQKVKNAGDACKRVHGGNSPRGIASPSFKHGRNSKYLAFLPQRFENLYEVIGDGALDLTEVAKVLQARFLDLVGRTHRGDSEELIRQAIKYCEELDEAQEKAAAARTAGDEAGMRHWAAVAGEAWTNIKNALKSNLVDWQTWNAAVDVATKTTRVVESQRRRLIEDKLMLSIDSVQAMMFAMAEAVNRNVDDADKLKRIQDDFRSISLHGLGGSYLGEIPNRDH
jgi:hypothetical protein